jgi:uncharacterized membrane protein HdeD (DUF308 family)
MSQAMSNPYGAVLGRIGKAWGWVLAFGVISILVGLAAIFMPGATLLAVAILFGAQLVVAGVFQFFRAFSVPDEAGWARALLAILAILCFIVGIYLLAHPLLTVLVLAFILGLFWLVSGFMELFFGFGHPAMPARGWTVASGILSVIAGAIVIFFPAISLAVLTLVLGIWLIIYGVLLVVRAIHLRSTVHGAAAARPTAAT